MEKVNKFEFNELNTRIFVARFLGLSILKNPLRIGSQNGTKIGTLTTPIESLIVSVGVVRRSASFGALMGCIQTPAHNHQTPDFGVWPGPEA